MIIGIMGAMPDEVEQLCAKLENVTVEPYGGVEYHKGTLAGKEVVVCCAGMGKANAAATTQVLITKFGAEMIIFSGIAGNMTSKIGIGVVVIGNVIHLVRIKQIIYMFNIHLLIYTVDIDTLILL